MSRRAIDAQSWARNNRPTRTANNPTKTTTDLAGPRPRHPVGSELAQKVYGTGDRRWLLTVGLHASRACRGEWKRRQQRHGPGGGEWRGRLDPGGGRCACGGFDPLATVQDPTACWWGTDVLRAVKAFSTGRICGSNIGPAPPVLGASSWFPTYI